jgi:hypothetical protein
MIFVVYRDFDQYCQQLSNQLSQLGLGFMADDLNRLWKTEQPPAKAGGLVLRTKVSDTGRIDPFMSQS